MRKIRESDLNLTDITKLTLAVSYKTGIAPRELWSLSDDMILYMAYLMQEEADANK